MRFINDCVSARSCGLRCLLAFTNAHIPQTSADEDIYGVHNVRARRMGHYTVVDLHVEVRATRNLCVRTIETALRFRVWTRQLFLLYPLTRSSSTRMSKCSLAILSSLRRFKILRIILSVFANTPCACMVRPVVNLPTHPHTPAAFGCW